MIYTIRLMVADPTGIEGEIEHAAVRTVLDQTVDALREGAFKVPNALGTVISEQDSADAEAHKVAVTIHNPATCNWVPVLV